MSLSMIHLRTATGKVFISVVGLLLTLLSLASCDTPSTTAVPVPTVPPLQFSTLDLGIPQKALDSPITGKVADDQVLHVSVTFKVNQAVVDQQAAEHKLKPGDSVDAGTLANQIGIADETYQKIKAYFGVENAKLQLGKLHTNLTIDAKASTFARLLQTSFVTHTLNGRTFFTPDPKNLPKLPATIANSILAVTGLDNYSLPPVTGHVLGTYQQAKGQTAQKAGASCNVQSNSLIPPEVAHAYGYDQLWKQGWHGENMTVNLVEIDGFAQSDVQNYFACAGFKGRLDVVNVDTSAPQPEGEATLDLEMISGMAPSAHIVDYQTDVSQANFIDVWTQVNDELQHILNDNAQRKYAAEVVSISLGQAEYGFTIGNYRAMHQSLDLLTKVEHMTIFVSSGDCGAFTDRIYKSLSVSYPASDNSVVAVGGTILGVDKNGARTSEVAWSDGSDVIDCHNQWGSGGGLSVIFSKPSWQNAPGVSNHYSNGQRQVPDISAVAYNVAVYYQGRWVVFGGTSAAAPIWAAGMLLVNQGMIQKKQVFFYAPDTFYQAANKHGTVTPYYDVTRGNNLYYPATAGWDYATGLGTPNLVGLFIDLYRQV